MESSRGLLKSRRSFLQMGTTAGLALTFGAMLPGRMATAFAQKPENHELGSGIGFPIPKLAASDPLAHITRGMFNSSMLTVFAFSKNGVPLTTMTLAEIDVRNPPFVKADPTSTRECFAVVFSGPSSQPLRQGTYDVSNKILGKFTLFIVPATTSGTVQHYEAVINRAAP
jgi:hypothetical protein